MRAGHFNPHGTRQGASVLASSGITLSASLSIAANSGEWKIAMLFEVYLGFADPGDQYLGQLLARLLPNSADFVVIPPHLYVIWRMNLWSMNSCFRGIITNGGRSGDGISLRSNTKVLLLQCSACMVHHANALREVAQKCLGHVLDSIPILSNGILCGELKKLLTSESSKRI